MNSKHRNIKFTLKREENSSLSYLDINIFRDTGKFQTSVHRKPTFSGVLTNFPSLLPISCKSCFYLVTLWFYDLLFL